MADLVRYLRDRGVIANTSGVWTLAQALPDIERELPESVRGMIERKIAQLEPEDHKLLTAASVQGYEFDSAVVAQVLNLDADEIEERLEKLERVFAFVKLASEAEFPNRTLTLKYRFVHVLYQNTLYASLRATRKATLSRDVAQALEGCYGERSASVANELALLWEAAREYARAADYFLQAARNAAQINAHREAVQLAERGLEALRKLPETPERDERELDLQLTLGFSLQSVLSWAAPETGAAFNRARQLCEQMGDDPRFFAALVGVWAYHIPRAEFETAHGLCEQMLQLGEQSQDPVLLVMASSVGPRSTIIKETLSPPISMGNARSLWIAGNTTRLIFLSVTRTGESQRAESIASVYGSLAIRIEPWRWRVKLSRWPSKHLIPSVWAPLIIRKGRSLPGLGIGSPARKSLRKCLHSPRSTPWETCSNMPLPIMP